MLNEGFQWQHVATMVAIKNSSEQQINWLVENNYFQLCPEMYEVFDNFASLNYLIVNHNNFIRYPIKLESSTLEKIKSIDEQLYKNIKFLLEME